MVVKIMVLFCGTLNNSCRTIIGTPKGTLILTTTHVRSPKSGSGFRDVGLSSLIVHPFKKRTLYLLGGTWF